MDYCKGAGVRNETPIIWEGTMGALPRNFVCPHGQGTAPGFRQRFQAFSGTGGFAGFVRNAGRFRKIVRRFWIPVGKFSIQTKSGFSRFDAPTPPAGGPVAKENCESRGFARLFVRRLLSQYELFDATFIFLPAWNQVALSINIVLPQFQLLFRTNL